MSTTANEVRTQMTPTSSMRGNTMAAVGAKVAHEANQGPAFLVEASTLIACDLARRHHLTALAWKTSLHYVSVLDGQAEITQSLHIWPDNSGPFIPPC